MKPLRIVLSTVGSQGDLYPFLALALELQRRGHHPVVATVEMYRRAVESEGLEFRLLRSVLVERPNSELVRKVFDPRTGMEFLIRGLIMPALPTAYADADDAIQGAALVVSHPLTMATPLAAEKAGIPWVSTQLSPMTLLSAYDPPLLTFPAYLRYMPSLGPAFLRLLLTMAKRSLRDWTAPYRQLRSALGLPPAADPMFEGGHSPTLDLALFSRLLVTGSPTGPRRPGSPAFLSMTVPSGRSHPACSASSTTGSRPSSSPLAQPLSSMRASSTRTAWKRR